MSKKSEWISVKDELPSKTGYYLVAFDGIELDIAYFRINTHWSQKKGIVTHWLPLPKSPKRLGLIGRYNNWI